MEKYPSIRKWLTVGIILLFIGVALAPSINNSIVKASNDNDLVEVTSQACGINRTMRNKIAFQSESIFFKRINDIFKKGDSLKHPLLYYIVWIRQMSRMIRAYFLYIISNSGYYPGQDVKYPLLYLRCLWLLYTFWWSIKFWHYVSDSLGWNWPY